MFSDVCGVFQGSIGNIFSHINTDTQSCIVCVNVSRRKSGDAVERPVLEKSGSKCKIIIIFTYS